MARLLVLAALGTVCLARRAPKPSNDHLSHAEFDLIKPPTLRALPHLVVPDGALPLPDEARLRASRMSAPGEADEGAGSGVQLQESITPTLTV